MKIKNIIIGFLLISTSLFGQGFNFDIQNTSLDEYMKMEEILGGKKIQNESRYYSGKGIAQPIRFQRKEKRIPDCIVSYQFYEIDSLLTEIEYEWDVSNFEKHDNNQKSKKFQKTLISKYIELKTLISKDFGKPQVKKNYSNISRLDSINTFVESSTWKLNESTEIELYATISNYYEKKGVITINPVHRIRLYVINQSKKKEKETPKIDDKKLTELEKIKIDFFDTLKNKDLPKSKEYLSDLIIDKVTDEQINMLINNINFEKKTELISSGVQMGSNNSIFTLLQYKYSDDKSSPPTEIIKLIFDDKNKIVGIQPIKLQNKITD